MSFINWQFFLLVWQVVTLFPPTSDMTPCDLALTMRKWLFYPNRGKPFSELVLSQFDSPISIIYTLFFLRRPLLSQRSDYNFFSCSWKSISGHQALDWSQYETVLQWPPWPLRHGSCTIVGSLVASYTLLHYLCSSNSWGEGSSLREGTACLILGMANHLAMEGKVEGNWLLSRVSRCLIIIEGVKPLLRK